MKNSYSNIPGIKERTMKLMTGGKALMLAGVLGFACLLPATVQAQVDAQPDTNLSEGPNMERIGAQTALAASPTGAKTDFAGTFSLPYNVTCGAKNLKPGHYSVSVKSQGTSRVVTIHGNAAELNNQARAVPANPGTSHSALLVRKSGEVRRLEAVYVEGLNATLYLEANMIDGVTERLPIS
jgi:hypothetical protein